MSRQIGPGPSGPPPAAPVRDEAARARARPFRLIQMVSVGDAVAGVFLHYLSPRLGVPGEALGMPVMEFVGLALIVIGAAGYVLFELLARAAMRRAAPPRPLR